MRLEYFQMIDRFVDVDVGARLIRSVCSVPKENKIFEGHFPGYPLMPGVLLIECMAQTTGWLVSGLTGFTGLPVLASIKEGKIRNAVYPGSVLDVEARIVHEGSGYAIGDAKATCKGVAVCDARLTYRLIRYPDNAFRKTMQEWAAQLNFPLKEFAK
jgi:3-hydroxyacyl-[acyl-carrier-protein] dehydratase